MFAFSQERAHHVFRRTRSQIYSFLDPAHLYNIMECMDSFGLFFILILKTLFETHTRKTQEFQFSGMDGFLFVANV